MVVLNIEYFTTFFYKNQVFEQKILNFLDFLKFSNYNIIMKKIIVNEKYENKKLNNFILDTFPKLSTNTLYKALRKKDIRINGKRISENCTIYTGDEITIFITDEFLFGASSKLEIIYEDNNILVINKPVRNISN